MGRTRGLRQEYTRNSLFTAHQTPPKKRPKTAKLRSGTHVLSSHCNMGIPCPQKPTRRVGSIRRMLHHSCRCHPHASPQKRASEGEEDKVVVVDHREGIGVEGRRRRGGVPIAGRLHPVSVQSWGTSWRIMMVDWTQLNFEGSCH